MPEAFLLPDSRDPNAAFIESIAVTVIRPAPRSEAEGKGEGPAKPQGKDGGR